MKFKLPPLKPPPAPLYAQNPNMIRLGKPRQVVDTLESEDPNAPQDGLLKNIFNKAAIMPNVADHVWRKYVYPQVFENNIYGSGDYQ